MTTLLAAGCRPDPGPSLALISSPRVVALRGTPAELLPGGTVTFEALVASPDGETMPSLDWSLCHAARPLTTNDVVSPACLTAAGVDVLGAAPTITATVPTNACQLFGPETPPSTPGQPDPRPVAADASGGWYQPYRADFANAHNVGLQRIRCNLAGATAEVAAQFRMSYQSNLNPAPAALLLDGAPADGQTLIPGAHQLTLRWPAEAAESYPIFDVASQTLVTHREALRVSWFASAGTLAEASTGRAGDDPALETSNMLTTEGGPVHIWAVLRDDRGGAGWVHARLE